METKFNWIIKRQNFSPSDAQRIMGKNFFGVEDAIKYFGIKPTEKDLEVLKRIPYSKSILRKCQNTHILVVILPISISEIKEKAKRIFYGYDSPRSWYKDQDFIKEKNKPSWQLIRKNAILDSTSKSLEEQLKLLNKDEEVPTVQIMVYTITGHYLKTGEWLFEYVCVRTSSVDSYGRQIDVGGKPLGINFYWIAGSSANIGLTSAQKPDVNV